VIKKNYLKIYAKSFYWAGFFLPKKVYEKCSDLYDFCRFIDNIADEENDLKIKIEKLDNLKNEFKSKNFNNPIIKGMWNLIDEINFSSEIIYDLFDGVESDLKEKVKLNSKKELLVYSYRVAGTVGLMMAKILNVKEEYALKGAIDLGIAMQLTNISRDVIEDSKSNRFYIPSNFNSIKDTIMIADQFYNSSFYSIKEIPIKFQLSILIARRVYRKIGYKILNKNNFENYKKSGKIYVNIFEKVYESILSVLDYVKLQLIKKKSTHQLQNEHNLILEEINMYERF